VRWIRRAHRFRRASAASAQHAPAAASRASAGEQSARADFVSFQPGSSRIGIDRERAIL